MRKFFTLILIGVFAGLAAQTADEQLAAQYFSEGDFEKASAIYKRLIKKHPSSTYVYENYLSCLLSLSDYDEAKSLVKKKIRRNAHKVGFEVDYGYVLLQEGEKTQAQEWFNDLLSKPKNETEFLSLAQSFSRRQLGEYALESYDNGAKKMGNSTFWKQRMLLYSRYKKWDDVSNLTTNLLDKQPDLLSQVYKRLAPVLEDEAAITSLQSAVIVASQSSGKSTVFDELLLKIFNYKKEYRSAFRIVKALDKREESNGGRLIEFAREMIKLRQYELAANAYKTAMDHADEAMLFYDEAQRGMLEVAYLALEQSILKDAEESRLLNAEFDRYFEEKSFNAYNSNLANMHASLNLYMLKDVAKGVGILEKAIEVDRLSGPMVGQLRLTLGDAYLIQGNIWDAKLMYGQVDKLFKEEALGQEARFRNARLSYFNGDFEWAKSQLDILKTATTQLISNNAIELSLLIQDNTGLDSTEDAMKEYAHADFLLFQNKLNDCAASLNMLPINFPNHALQDEVIYLLARLEEKRGDFDKALKLYTRVYESHSEDILADNAVFQSAEILLFAFGKEEEAKAMYEKILLEYNSSLFAVEARKKFYALKAGQSKDQLSRYGT